jgi:hypothetical protein
MLKHLILEPKFKVRNISQTPSSLIFIFLRFQTIIRGIACVSLSLTKNSHYEKINDF